MSRDTGDSHTFSRTHRVPPPSACLGVHECTFHIDRQEAEVAVGIVPANKIDASAIIGANGYAFMHYGKFFYPRRSSWTTSRVLNTLTT